MTPRPQCEICGGFLGLDFANDEWCPDEGICATCFMEREGEGEPHPDAHIEYSNDPFIDHVHNEAAARHADGEHPAYEFDNCPRCGTAQRRLPPLS